MNTSGATASQVTSNNTGNTTTPAWVLYERPLFIWTLSTLSICGCGAVLYVLLLTVLIRGSSYRSGCGLLILHQIVVEMSMVAVHIPLNILNVHLGHFNLFTPRDCAAIHFSFNTTLVATNWSQLILASNRFAATLHPHFYRHLVNKPMLFAQIGLTWSVGFAIYVPRLFGVGGVYGTDRIWGNCAFVTKMVGAYVAAGVAVGVYIPAALLIVLYLLIFLRLGCFRGRIVDFRANSDQRRRFQRRVMMARVLFATSFWYCICYYPQNILGSLRVAAYERSVAGLQLWLRTLYTCGYVMTPLFFFALNHEYRAGLVDLFYKCFHILAKGQEGRGPPSLASTKTVRTGNNLPISLLNKGSKTGFRPDMRDFSAPALELMIQSSL